MPGTTSTEAGRSTPWSSTTTRSRGPRGRFAAHVSPVLWLISLQANIDAPCTLLDFPGLNRFIEEIPDHAYDIVGISAIMTNVGKVRVMCELVRTYLPRATIVVGGHIAPCPIFQDRIDADHICQGDGVTGSGSSSDWTKGTRQASSSYSGFGTRSMGIAPSGQSGKQRGDPDPFSGLPRGV